MYLYNGKELNTDFGLDMLDYGARWYDPSIARWHSVDPLAEKYSNNSPYNYVTNSPISNLDPDGRFKFPAYLKNKYPRAYKHFVKNNSLRKWADNGHVMKTLITNTRYNQAKRKQIRAKLSGKGLSSDVTGILNSPTMRLTKSDILKAFSDGDGQEIIIRPDPHGNKEASGYNGGNFGTNYTNPIELNEAAFELLNNAQNEEEVQLALLNIYSTIVHEYMENFGTDTEDFGFGDFGAYPAQDQLFGNRFGVLDDFTNKPDKSFSGAKKAKSYLEKYFPHLLPKLIN